MFSPSELRRRLSDELRREALLPDPSLYQRHRTAVTHYGTIEARRIIELAGRRAWKRALARLGRAYPHEDCVRVLGFGRALTEFVIAPISLPEQHRNLIAELGALANLIVATFDQLIDHGIDRRLVLAEPPLRWMMRRSGRAFLRIGGLLAPAPARVMCRLVSAYFRDLERLTLAQHATAIARLVRHIIVRMYRSESHTLDYGRFSLQQLERILRRKAALPIALLGLPAWLVVPTNDCYTWHLRWLYELGDFMGWVDDVVDLEEDIKTGHPNRVSLLIMRGSPTVGWLATSIARRGVHIMREWGARIEPNEEVHPLARVALPTCLVSWIPDHHQGAQ